MKKLIFFLLVLTGAGILSSCQQDEVVNEVPASKGATIRASLPSDAQSRVLLGDTGSDETSLSWQSGDQIKVNITGQEYTFTTTETGTTANFTCADAPATLPAGVYTFTYGSSPQTEQTGTKEGLSTFHQMTDNFVADSEMEWENVNLEFETTVALVEISLNNGFIHNDNPATKVTMYDVKNGTCLATATGSFTDKVYFSVTPETYQVRFVIETEGGDKYVKKLSSEYTMQSNKLYRIKHTETNKIELIDGKKINENNNVMRYFKHGGTLYVYGNEAIPNGAFNKSDFNDIQSVIILDGVTGIGDNAFSGRLFTTVTIPASVQSIGEKAFYQCANLKKVVVPYGVTKIEDEAFYSCGVLTNVIIPASVSSIGDDAFCDCI